MCHLHTGDNPPRFLDDLPQWFQLDIEKHGAGGELSLAGPHRPKALLSQLKPLSFLWSLHHVALWLCTWLKRAVWSPVLHCLIQIHPCYYPTYNLSLAYWLVAWISDIPPSPSEDLALSQASQLPLSLLHRLDERVFHSGGKCFSIIFKTSFLRQYLDSKESSHNVSCAKSLIPVGQQPGVGGI